MKRASYIGAPQQFNLNHACRVLVDAFGPHVYLVGSALERRDFRDVDVRCILPDAEFDRMFPGAHPYASQLHAGWSVVCSAISLWLSEHSRLPVDFQFQRQTQANEEEQGTRSALGMFIEPPPRSSGTPTEPKDEQ